MEDEKALKGNKTISTEPKDTLTNTKDTEKETKTINNESTETKETNTEIKNTKEVETKDINTKVENDTKEIETDTNVVEKETKNTDKNTDKKNNNTTKKGYGNNGNLIPFTERSESEVREMNRNGGIASGIARREKKVVRDRLKTLLDLKPSTKEMELLEAQGIASERDESTKSDIIALIIYREAVKGNMRAIDKIIDIQDEIALKEESKTTDIIGALNITAKDVWSDNNGDTEPQNIKETEDIKDTEPKGGGDNAT